MTIPHNRRESDPVHDELIKIKSRLEEHLKNFERHEKEELRRYSEYFKIQHSNKRKIDDLCRSTSDLVDAWQAAEGVVKFGVTVGKFVKWLGGFAIIMAMIDWLTGKH